MPFLFISFILLALSPLYVKNEAYPIERWLVFFFVLGVGLLSAICYALHNYGAEGLMKFCVELDEELETNRVSKERREKIREEVMKGDKGRFR